VETYRSFRDRFCSAERRISAKTAQQRTRARGRRVPDEGEVRELVAFLRGCRAENGLADRPFDIVIGGKSPAGEAGRDLAGSLADLGVTWWDERMHWGADLERVEPILNRIEQGPPRL